jgi:hydrogenase expression/formation protein HypE
MFKKLLIESIKEKTIKNGEAMIEKISIVPEAMKAIESGEVHSLHDPTEGGVLNGLWEMAEASNVGLEIIEENIPVYKETLEICEKLKVDPLKLLGSGALIIVSSSKDSEKILEKLNTIDIPAGIIGEITAHEKGRWLVRRDGSKKLIKAVKQDEIYRLIDMHKSFLED